MNRLEKELAQLTLEQEKAVLKELEEQYKKAMLEIENKIKGLLARTDDLTANLELDNLPSIIYQLKYQNALKGQIGAILDLLQANQFNSIQDYLKTCYEDGFIGVLYDLQGQDIPLIFPIDQEQMVRAIMHDTKLSEPLYTKLGHDLGALKKEIRSVVSRGIASNMSFDEISRLIRINGDTYKNKAFRIARTEGHRIQNEAAYDCQLKAKDAGADIVKQWDATLDRRTRKSHAELDGKIVDVDEAFEFNGHTAMYPGGFGVASLDVNCRCAILQRAKWALDEGELETLKERASYYGLDKTKDFKDFREKYYNVEDWLSEQNKFCEKYGITYNEQAALTQYISSNSYKLNEALRNNSVTSEQQIAINHINSALNKIPSYQGDLTRSLKIDNKELLDNFLKEHKVGKTINYKEFISTTKGEIYNPDGQIQIVINNAKKGKDISLFNYQEDEVLYNTNSKFEVEDLYELEGKYYILLKELE